MYVCVYIYIYIYVYMIMYIILYYVIILYIILHYTKDTDDTGDPWLMQAPPRLPMPERR